MAVNIPDNLVFPGSTLRLDFESTEKVNRTTTAIIVSGSRTGFLSLANCLLYLSNELNNVIPIHELPFIDSQIELDITVIWEESRLHGHLSRETDKRFVWKLTEESIDQIAAGIHSLGHLNPELHIDKDFSENEISVYCVVE